LIKEVARIDKVCPYLDLPLQHTSDRILKSMGRPESKVVFSLIERLREEIPEIVLRTTMMVGFPGETAEEFGKLLTDVQRLRFDWLGAFPYSKERGTKAASFGQRPSKKTVMERYEEIMTLQQEITYSKNLERVGQTFSCLADKKDCGRTFFQAPEIDGQVLFQRDRKEGELFKAKILGVKEVYDLIS
ncbi:radical SAM protein, partial [bacterium]|nr:radical SAM protein [bacterium]